MEIERKRPTLTLPRQREGIFDFLRERHEHSGDAVGAEGGALGAWMGRMDESVGNITTGWQRRVILR